MGFNIKNKILLFEMVFVVILLSMNVMADSSIKTQGVRVFVIPVVNMTTPFDKVYTSRQIPLNVITNGAIELRYSDNNANFRTMCRRSCSKFVTNKPFEDGKHSLIVQSIFEEGGIVLTSVNFTVDTKKPIMRKTYPLSDFANGSFALEFEEVNPVALVLNYGNNQTGYENVSLNLAHCTKQKYYFYCSVSVNLSKYDQQSILYWFDIQDIANNRVQTKIKYIGVDFVKPIINSFNYTLNKNKVSFIMNISEKNFYEVLYIDHSSLFPKWSIFCSKLDKGICQGSKTFLTKEHEIEFNILDKAGNSAERDVSFSIN